MRVGHFDAPKLKVLPRMADYTTSSRSPRRLSGENGVPSPRHEVRGRVQQSSEHALYKKTTAAAVVFCCPKAFYFMG